MAQKRKMKIRPRFIAVIFILCVVGVCSLYFSQQQKLLEIEEERVLLESKLNELTNQEQSLEYAVEYRKSSEGKIQYARETFGFVGDDDIVFDLND